MDYPSSIPESYEDTTYPTSKQILMHLCPGFHPIAHIHPSMPPRMSRKQRALHPRPGWASPTAVSRWSIRPTKSMIRFWRSCPHLRPPTMNLPINPCYQMYSLGDGWRCHTFTMRSKPCGGRGFMMRSGETRASRICTTCSTPNRGMRARLSGRVANLAQAGKRHTAGGGTLRRRE